ncbi:MAG: CYTH domain-containing protein [Clostridiales bacterium]|jgi:CYTH domain-containing protein|nr:CYTH domain-containing protein [Clostridiales bacterium]
MEIERKFLLNSFPHDINQYESVEIEQSYISVDPVIRLRRRNNEYILTIKQTGLLAREEAEFVITKEQYERLWDKVETNVIRKTRVLIPLQDGLIAEADIYRGVLQGLLTIEVEFDSVQQAMTFNPPEWFGNEVTDNPKYSNSALAINGLFTKNNG